MGEFILYYHGKIVGGIYDDRLLVKKTRTALELMPAAICELPYEEAKEMLLVDKVDSKEFLAELFLAMCDELPSPKRKNNGIGGTTDELYSNHKRKYWQGTYLLRHVRQAECRKKGMAAAAL